MREKRKYEPKTKKLIPNVSFVLLSFLFTFS
jgi:hypothetical protein